MVTTIGLVGHVAGLIGQHHWNTQRVRKVKKSAIAATNSPIMARISNDMII
jgi:hypothetical protein